MIKISLLISLHFFVCLSISSGQSLAALEEEIRRSAQQDTNYVQMLIKAGDMHSDNKNFEKANNHFQRALKISQKENYTNGIIKANYYQALSYRNEGKYKLSEEHHLRAIELSEKNNYSDQLMRSYLNLGNTYRSWGIYDKALDSYLKSLNYAQKLKNKRIEAANYNNIGEVYRFHNQLTQALEFYENALKISREINDERQIAANLNNIGTIHFRRQNYPKAEEYFKESLSKSEKIKNKRLELINSINLGNIYLKKDEKSINLAIEYQSRASQLSQELKDWYNFSISTRNLARCYALKKDYAKAEELLQEAIKKAEEIDAKEEKANGYYDMIVLKLQKNEDWQVVYEYEQKYSKAISEIQNKTLTEKIAELQQSYEYKQKEAEIALLKKENQVRDLKAKEEQMLRKEKQQENEILLAQNELLLAENRFKETAIEKEKLSKQEALIRNEKIKKEKELLEKETLLKEANLQKQKYLTIGVAGIATLIGIFAIWLARAYTIRKKLTETLQIKNKEIGQQKEEILTQRDLLDKQNKLLNHQKNEILSSIVYAKNIQQALLPTEKELSKNFDVWVLYLPRDIVSGDFYYLAEKNQKIILGLADCTGHGVPGAFMSSLGISILNSVIASNDEPAKILKELDLNLTKSLHQESGEDANNGLEISLLVIDKSERKIQFASANRPIWLTIDGDEAYEIAPTSKESIGIIKKSAEKVYKNVDICFQKSIQVFAYSDGFQDQFGGEKNKKLSKKRFYELLNETLKQPFEIQKAFLQKKYEEWKGTEPQLDDVSVISFRIYAQT